MSTARKPPAIRQTATRDYRARRTVPYRRPGARRRRAGPGSGLPPAFLPGPPLARARRARAHVSPPPARLRLAAAAAESGAAQPPLGLGQLRNARRLLPLGPRRTSLRPLPIQPNRGLDPDLSLRAALRPLNGLRGLPRHTHARSLGRTRGQQT